MVTESTREAVWKALIYSARRGRYCGALANRYQRRDRIIRSLLLASVMGSVTTFVAALPAGAQAVVGVVVAGVLIADFVRKPARNATLLGLIRDECDQSKGALKELWMDLPTIDDAEARRRLDDLNRRLQHVTSKDPVPEDERVNLASTEAVYAEMKAGYVS